jgi:hypothetical protein
MDCGYCHKRFRNNKTLNTHQATAKYCLKIQGIIDNVSSDYICITCEQSFIREDACNKHMVFCKTSICGKIIEKLRNDNYTFLTNSDAVIEKLRTDSDAMIEKLRTDSDAMIEKLRTDNSYKEGMIALMQDKIDRQEAKNISMEKSLIDIKVLQKEVDIYKSQSDKDRDCIEQIAKQPKMTTTTTNNILNMHTLDLSDDRVKNMIEECYNIDYLLAGSKGVAQFTVDKVLTKPDDKIIYSLTDRSREAYNFKNAEGVIEKDTKGRKLREVVYKNGIKEKAFSIANIMVLEDPVKASELRCIECALEVANLDPSTIRTKEVNDKVEHAYCKELRETAC